MKFSVQWLREWVNPAVDADQLAAQFTMAGLEVDAVESVAGDFSGVVVGEILSVEPHPDAQKLRVCQVAAGTDAPLSIVCGAPNAQAGMKVPTARVGAQLPGLKIKKAKLRGVESFGMLCSASELGLAESASGLLPLPPDAPVGQDIREYLGLEDVAIDIDFTPNRGDCLSIQGMARETGTLNQCPVVGPVIDPVSPQSEETFPVAVTAPEDCPRYVGRVVRGVRADARTPLWMEERLRRSGLRGISPVVDITNYVLLELGQPMHAFDLGQLDRGIVVRAAEANEKLTLLDGQEVFLEAGDLVIADQTQALALAGVMGGADSGVTDQTTDVFLESAYFTPSRLAGRARRLGLQTDSSYRFERGVDPHGQSRAMERATALLLEICGGTPGPIIEHASEAHWPRPTPITLRGSRIATVLGMPLSPETVRDLLQRLGMEVNDAGEAAWRVVPPAFRHDIALEVDLIEELARIVGYDQLPATPRVAMQPRMRELPGVDARDLRRMLVAAGYREAITYSFVDPARQAKIHPDTPGIPLANPIAADMAVMRTSLWAGLLQAAQHNWQRQQKELRLFELGLCFQGTLEDLRQPRYLGGLLVGAHQPEQWGEAQRGVDFFDLKQDVERLLAPSRGAEPDRFVAAEHPALHPGQSAKILRGEQWLGWIGALHPALVAEWELPDEVFLFELSLSPLLTKSRARYQAISKFPSVRRDLALLVENSIKAADLLALAQATGGELLTHSHVFDIYEGKGIPEGKKSIAIGLTFRSAERNLTEQEVDGLITDILAALTHTFHATLRE